MSTFETHGSFASCAGWNKTRGSVGRLFSAVIFTGVIVAGGRAGFAVDEAGLKSEFSLPGRSRSSVESADEYSDAVQRLHDAEAGVVRAREQAMKDLQSGNDYTNAVKDLESSYSIFSDKKNALLADLEKKDPRCLPVKKQMTEIDAEIEAAKQNPASTTEKLDELYRNRATFAHQWDDLVDSAIKRENLEPSRHNWQLNSDKVVAMREQQRVDVEKSDKLKNAKAQAAVARAAVDQTKAALEGPPLAADAQEDQASDYLRRFPRFGFGGNDAWWTYGWSPIYGSASGQKPGMPK